MDESDDLPLGTTVVEGATAAAAVAIFSLIGLDVFGWWPAVGVSLTLPYLFWGTPVVFGHAFGIALPLYMTLRRRTRMRWWHAGLAGFLIGFVPTTLFLSVMAPSDGGGNLPLKLLPLGLIGFAAGLTFWLVLRRSGSCR